MIIMKFGQKKLVSLVFGKVNENSPKHKNKCYFTKITWKRVIYTGNPLFRHKIRSKRNLERKNGLVLFWAKCTKNCAKIREKCYLTKLTSKRVRSTGNILFAPKIR